MNIILLGYNGLIGRYILEQLVHNFKNNNDINVICVGRNNKSKFFKNKIVKYVKWDFLNFSDAELSFFKKKNIIINCVGKNNNRSKNLKYVNLVFVKKLINYLKKKKISSRLIQLGSVSVYDNQNKKLSKIKNITENSKTKAIEIYSKSKLEADNQIKKSIKINSKKLSYTILRISNVFGDFENSSAFLFVRFLLNKGIWLKYSNYTKYHFIHAKDVACAVLKCILNLEKSRNKIYIVSDDQNQLKLHKFYAKNKDIELLKISVPSIFFNLLKYFFFSKKIQNLFFTISSEINYDNSKIIKELNFKTKYSLEKKII